MSIGIFTHKQPILLRIYFDSSTQISTFKFTIEFQLMLISYVLGNWHICMYGRFEMHQSFIKNCLRLRAFRKK